MQKHIQYKTCTEVIDKMHTYYHEGDLNQASDLINLIQNTPTLCPDEMEEMKITMIIGLIKLKKGEYKEAEANLLKSLELAMNFGDSHMIHKRYDNLAALYTNTKQIGKAIDYLTKSLYLKESSTDESAQALSLLQMSNLLFSILDYEEGRIILKKAARITEHLDDIELKMMYYFAYGNLLIQDKKYDEAVTKFDLVIEYSNITNDVVNLCRAYYNKGLIMIEQGHWEEAEKIYTELIEITRKYELANQELLACVQLASVALKQNKVAQSRLLFDYITSHSEMDHDDEGLKEDIAQLSAHLYEAEGKPDKALEAYRAYMHIYKKHYDNEQSNVVLYVKAKYENEKNERELQEIRIKQMESEMKALKSEQALRENEKRFKAWIENGTDMIVIFKSDLKPTYTSPSIYRSFGYSKDFFKTTDPYSLIHIDDTDSVLEALKIAHESPGVAVTVQFRFKENSGHYVWIESSFTNLLHDETINGIVCNLKDITERKQSEAAIQEMNKSLELKITERTSELQDAINDLEAFSYSVSHDLRSPLRIITGYAKLLITDHEQTLNEESKEFINTIIDNARRMSQLIDDLLNFSRMGRKAVYKTTIDTHTMVENILADVRRTDASITQDIFVHDLKPAFCDMALIKQVWINLISNAIKYSGKNPNPIIEIGCKERANETIYYVKDNGAGFDMRFAKKLFTVFKRLHDRSEYEGMGVGLALAHRIIKMHEGKIWAEAEVNKGATFYFSLGNKL